MAPAPRRGAPAWLPRANDLHVGGDTVARGTIRQGPGTRAESDYESRPERCSLSRCASLAARPCRRATNGDPADRALNDPATAGELKWGDADVVRRPADIPGRLAGLGAGRVVLVGEADVFVLVESHVVAVDVDVSQLRPVGAVDIQSREAASPGVADRDRIDDRSGRVVPVAWRWARKPHTVAAPRLGGDVADRRVALGTEQHGRLRAPRAG